MSTVKLEINDAIKDRISPFIDLNDKLRRLTVSEDDINPTTIVVVGDQSAGKSSVLEALSGIDLPRGEGIQTRLPLVLSLRELPGKSPDEYAEIFCEASGSKRQRILVGEVESHIKELTNQVAGQGKNISNAEIELQVYRKSIPELTLIDLPGLTRVAITGQDENIEEVLTDMYTRYMKPEETVILNVVTAVVDVTTSASLKLSAKLDPNRKRTLICFTKVDQVTDKGLKDKLFLPVKEFSFPPKNIVCVRNRTSEENMQKVSYDDARKIEKQFFANHPELSQLPTAMLTTIALANRLVEVQLQRLCETLPKNLRTIEQRLCELRQEMHEFEGIPKTASDCRSVAMSAIRDLHRVLVDGRRGFPNAKQESSLLFNLSIEYSPTLIERTASLPIRNKFGIWSLEIMTTRAADVYHHHLAIRLLRPTHVKSTIDVLSMIRGIQPEPKTINFKLGPETNRKQMKIEAGESGLIHVMVAAHTASNKGVGEKLLCAHIGVIKEEFADACADLQRTRDFFSPFFLRTTARVFEFFSGVEGMPGTQSPVVPVSILRNLQRPLFTEARKFTRRFREVLKEFVLREIDCKFDQFSGLNYILQESFDSFEKSRWEDINTLVEGIISCEEVIETRNHYFMDNVNGIRKSIANGNFSDLGIDFESIMKLNNGDQKQIEALIEVCAYWKTMRKRFVDYVILAVQRNLFHDGTEDRIQETLAKSVEKLNDSQILEVMSLRKDVLRDVKQLDGRIRDLEEAQIALRGLLYSNDTDPQ